MSVSQSILEILETITTKNTHLSMCPENVYPVHEHDKQRRKPTRRPRPRPCPRQKLLKFVNEVMPFLTSRSSSPRFRMELTKGNVNMHFENITNDKTCNAGLRRIYPKNSNSKLTTYLLNHWKPTTKETNPGLQAPPRYSQREHTVL